MAAPVVIADELTALGLRLGGCETIVFDEQPGAAEIARLASAFERACREAPLVMVSAALARHLPRAQLEAALLAESPLVAVMPDVEERALAQDVEIEVRRALGVGA